MKKYIIIFIMLLCLVGCDKKDDTIDYHKLDHETIRLEDFNELSDEEIISIVPDGILNYSIDNCNLDVSTISDINVISQEKIDNILTIKCELTLDGAFLNRKIYCELLCRDYDNYGWLVDDFTEYKRQDIILVNGVDYTEYLIPYSHTRYEIQDNSTYSDNNFDYRVKIGYNVDSVGYIDEIITERRYGSVIYQDNIETKDVMEYTWDMIVAGLGKEYVVNYDSVLGPRAVNNLNLVIVIESMDDETVEWTALQYEPNGDIVDENVLGRKSGSSQWYFNDEGSACFDFDIDYKYKDGEPGFFSGQIQIPVNPDGEWFQLIDYNGSWTCGIYKIDYVLSDSAQPVENTTEESNASYDTLDGFIEACSADSSPGMMVSANDVYTTLGENKEIFVYFAYQEGNLYYTVSDVTIADCAWGDEWINGNIIPLYIDAKSAGDVIIEITNDQNDIEETVLVHVE